MPYAYFTLGQAKNRLAQRLYDASKKFFADPELGVYINEALQTFNALANFNRAEFVFPSQQNVTWYDLTDTTNLPNTLRPMTATVLDLLQVLEYHLLEPLNSAYPLTWGGSTQFTMDDLLAAIQQMRDQLLSDSSCTLTESLVAAVPGRIFLADNVLDLRRVCWLPVGAPPGFTASCLLPGDNWMAQSFEAGYPQLPRGTPGIFLRSAQPPLSFDVDIQSAVPGNYDILSVNAGAAVTSTAAVTLPVPNDWVWVMKWGILANLLSRDTTSRDIYRAQYAQARYKQGVEALMRAPALLAARINDVPVSVDAIREGDTYRANWQGLAAGAPDSVLYAGLNQVALVPKPDAGPYSVTASVVANMPIPATDGTNLQLGRDDVESVLDYAQHIATFKCGGAEFAGTFPLLQSFLSHCALFNSKLDAQSLYKELLYGRAQQERSVNPVFEGAAGG